ncbi:MAG: bifunctional riboflavin kinase/FAD synthetase [Bacteroidetes bacterium]|nr:bifunctional riboflavin kinase/FAD synthetase [Bacteroidota bacterium]
MNIEDFQSHLHLCLNRPTVLTIGVFDGVHLGHQHLIRRVHERARELGYLAGVVTLYPHPQQIIAPDFQVAYLTTLEERLYLLRRQGVDWVAVLRFDTQVAQASAAQFVRMLKSCLQFRELWVGPDFALGKGREGDLARLRHLGGTEGFTVHVVAPHIVDDEVVNSTRVRQALTAGSVQDAAKLLGRPVTLIGRVVAGAQRGRQLGFPTANLEVDEQLLVPANGVYVAYACWNNRCCPALVNIGHRPTFDDGPRSIEAYLLQGCEDLYGKQITLEFRERLRSEVRFPGPEALAAQITEDVRRAKSLLKIE